jgi:hypothetical protein
LAASRAPIVDTLLLACLRLNVQASNDWSTGGSWLGDLRLAGARHAGGGTGGARAAAHRRWRHALVVVPDRAVGIWVAWVGKAVAEVLSAVAATSTHAQRQFALVE